jgi:3-phenylpropionate/cinnamic acid dioxygenase small subunit
MAANNGEIIDKQHIQELQNYYSYSIDSGQYDQLDAMFTPDATYHFVTGSTDNIESLKNTIRDALSTLTTSQHINGNQWADIDGDLAKAGCYFTVHMYKEGLANGEHFEMGGRYDDELVRTADGWRFSKRTITILWSDGNPKVRWQD